MNICAIVRANPVGFIAAASGGSSSFTVIQSVGCGGYTPVPNVSWLNVTSTVGSTVNFTVAANSGAQRSGAIVVNYNNGQFATAVNFNVTQLANNCTYGISPTSITFTSNGGTGSINLTTPAGCTWTATSNAPWVTITGGSSGSGNGTISYSVQANNGPARSATITAGGQTFTINQASGCTYSLDATSQNFSANGGFGIFTVTTSNSACSWTATNNASWITFIGSPSGTGTGTVSYAVQTNPGQARSSTITVGGQTLIVNQSGAAPQNRAPFDFDGDGKTDVSIFRPAVTGGEWWWRRSSDGGFPAVPFGNPTDIIAPGDFTGDGKMDLTIWRPSTGFWFIVRSEDNSFFGFPFGANGDIPATGDYDGDGKADAAVYRPSVGQWFIQRSSDGQVQTVQFGLAGDQPVAADYDGDGKTDVAIFPRQDCIRRKYSYSCSSKLDRERKPIKLRTNANNGCNILTC
ncbi:BACON domain-containing protein [Leptolyngbya sp. 7M]|uniref:BACON domain-containing protein n=1 Tax=Leptolyngbya sp. 7M TaxID=2812896 RepID=UPI001CEC913A